MVEISTEPQFAYKHKQRRLQAETKDKLFE